MNIIAGELPEKGHRGFHYFADLVRRDTWRMSPSAHIAWAIFEVVKEKQNQRKIVFSYRNLAYLYELRRASYVFRYFTHRTNKHFDDTFFD